MPGDMPGSYVLLKLGDVDIGGIYQMEGEMFEGVPPHWAAYVSVEDVDATIAKALAAGASPAWPAIDVPGIGRMGGFFDPTGAALAVFKMGECEERPDLGEQHGFLCWNELATQDIGAASAFYAEVFGWTPRACGEDDPMQYTEWDLDGKTLGGMYQLNPDWGPIPSYWGVYVSVADCDATLAKAVELGAEVKAPATDIPEVGRFACIQDPTGAVLSFITMNPDHKR